MLFSRRFTFALGALLSFIANASAASGEGSFPDFISNWALFRRWEDITASIPVFDVPAMEDLIVGDWVNSEKKLTWECYTLTKDSLVANSLTVIIDKATLTWTDIDNQPQQQTVVSKRSGIKSGDGNTIMYGARLQKGLDHPNILPINHIVYGKGGVKDYGFAIMPYVQEGSVADNLGSLTDVNGAFKQMLAAVAAVSAAGIIHRDLKPENFLKDGDTIKLMDFDQSRDIGTTVQMDVGTPSYTAPEIIIGRDYTTKADTFSLAMSFLVMSVPDLRNSDDRFQLWKDLIEPPNTSYERVTADKTEEILRGRNYGVFNGNDGLLKVIAKAMCSESEGRYTPAEFETAFNGAT
ncbi:serine threonine kinase [Fusarium subglutinans]|uniref:Serine threonine kinase n=1 Tax=Gibberella subglutinans TaxID=42677 RepID=A0A8H5V080_GIBSU|nr:serine threonine kinase [Fusarium subglutinans]KAF5606002.1 serine threonine kinase [Fusarium subglutinans]